MNRARFVRLTAGAFAGLLITGCASSTAVTRNVGGRLVRGRFVTDDAYAAYLRGALFEAQGKREAALLAYTEGARRDPDSPELLTKIGALICDRQEGAESGEKPAAVFDRAAAIDPAYEEAWTERARCHLKRGQLADGENAARIAVALDPDRVEPALLLALVLERQARLDEARAWFEGLVISNPLSIEAHEAMAAFAQRTHDEPRRAEAERALIELGARGHRRYSSESARGTLADVDGAIARGAFDDARRLALSARLSSGALALRAAAVGAAPFAKEQADLVLAADPNDGDARIAAAVAADLLRDDDALARAMENAIPRGAAISPLAGLLMAELLERRIGPDAKKAWIDAAGAAANPAANSDSLIAQVAKRH